MNFYDSSHVSLWSIYFDGHFQDLFDPFFSGGEGVIKVINVVKWLVYQLSVPFSQQYQQIQWFPIHINTAANFISFIQGVPTSLEYAKCNVLKLRKVCERSGLCLQKDLIKKGEILNFDILFIGSFCKCSSLRSKTFLSFRTLHLAYPKLVMTPCICISLSFEACMSSCHLK